LAARAGDLLSASNLTGIGPFFQNIIGPKNPLSVPVVFCYISAGKKAKTAEFSRFCLFFLTIFQYG